MPMHGCRLTSATEYAALTLSMPAPSISSGAFGGCNAFHASIRESRCPLRWDGGDLFGSIRRRAVADIQPCQRPDRDLLGQRRDKLRFHGRHGGGRRTAQHGRHMGQAFGGGGGANLSLNLQLGSTIRPSADPAAEHLPPVSLGAGRSLPLVTPAPIAVQSGRPPKSRSPETFRTKGAVADLLGLRRACARRASHSCSISRISALTSPFRRCPA